MASTIILGWIKHAAHDLPSSSGRRDALHHRKRRSAGHQEEIVEGRCQAALPWRRHRDSRATRCSAGTSPLGRVPGYAGDVVCSSLASAQNQNEPSARRQGQERQPPAVVPANSAAQRPPLVHLPDRQAGARARKPRGQNGGGSPREPVVDPLSSFVPQVRLVGDHSPPTAHPSAGWWPARTMRGWVPSPTAIADGHAACNCATASSRAVRRSALRHKGVAPRCSSATR